MTEIKLFNRTDDLDGWLTQFGSSHQAEQARLLRLVQDHDQNERTILLAIKDNVYQGYVTIVWHSDYSLFRKTQTPEIVDLYVTHPYRRQGIGAALMAYTENLCRQRNIFRLGLTVDTDNRKAQMLYHSLGYYEQAQAALHDCPVLVMVKDIK